MSNGPVNNQSNLPTFANTTDLAAYAQDGLLPGFIAVTVSPFAFWILAATHPTGVTYVTAANSAGYWLEYGGPLTGAAASWATVTGAFTLTSGLNYDVDVSGGVASATFPAAPVDGQEFKFKAHGGAAARNFTLTRGAAQVIEQEDGTTANTYVFNTDNFARGFVYDLANTTWRLT